MTFLLYMLQRIFAWCAKNLRTTCFSLLSFSEKSESACQPFKGWCTVFDSLSAKLVKNSHSAKFLSKKAEIPLKIIQVSKVAWKAILWVTEGILDEGEYALGQKTSYSLLAWKAVPDFSLCNFRDVLPSRQYIERNTVIPEHPRYTRMYGVTHSIAFLAIPLFLQW